MRRRGKRPYQFACPGWAPYAASLCAPFPENDGTMLASSPHPPFPATDSSASNQNPEGANFCSGCGKPPCNPSLLQDTETHLSSVRDPRGVVEVCVCGGGGGLHCFCLDPFPLLSPNRGTPDSCQPCESRGEIPTGSSSSKRTELPLATRREL